VVDSVDGFMVVSLFGSQPEDVRIRLTL
jgi:hypothetical protein